MYTWTLFTLLAIISHLSVQSSTQTLFTLLAMISHLSVQSSTWTLFTLLAMISYLSVQSSTQTLFTLLAMITHLTVQSSIWRLFTLLAMITHSPGCPIIYTDTMDITNTVSLCIHGYAVPLLVILLYCNTVSVVDSAFHRQPQLPWVKLAKLAKLC